MPRPRVTRRDVAERAGTSVAVVSYVVNDGPRRVAEATRARVLRAIEETGYRPDRVATALARGSTGTLGLLLPSVANPFLGQLAHAVGSEVFAGGRTLLLGDASDDRRREAELAYRFMEQQADGILFYGVDRGSPAIDEIAASTPVVFIDGPVRRGDVGSVGIDERAAARAATEHLVEHGHEPIALIVGPLQQANSRDRLAGWCDALAGAGVAPDDDLVVEVAYDRDGGYVAGLRLMSEGGARPRAVFASNEQQALGFLAAAHEAGLRVPADVALVTFNGTSMSRYAIPSLTTVDQPVGRIAADAVAMLSGVFTPETVLHETVLKARTSCGCRPSPAPATQEAERRTQEETTG